MCEISVLVVVIMIPSEMLQKVLKKRSKTTKWCCNTENKRTFYCHREIHGERKSPGIPYDVSVISIGAAVRPSESTMYLTVSKTEKTAE